MDFKYKIIKLQELEKRKQTLPKNVDAQILYQQIKPEARWKGGPLYYEDTGASKQRIIQSEQRFRTNSFFSAFQKAYINHGDVFLVPDQIWLVILSFFSKYVDKNSEKLRQKLVLHKGFKELIVQQEFGQIEGDDKRKELWQQFFELMLDQIKKNTVEGVVDLFKCDFSTTQKIHEIISTSMIMNTFKSFFKYSQFSVLCGINNIYMAGEKSDWEKLPEKLKKLEQFDVNGVLKEYIQKLLVILENFILTFDNKPDLQWWNSIMKTQIMQIDYVTTEMQVEGWILHFFGLYGKQDSSEFQDLSIMVPIKQVNQKKGTEKNLYLISGWNSVSKINERTYKPDIGLSIVEQSTMQDRKHGYFF